MSGFVAFNRTSMELKLEIQTESTASHSPFNRTSMELKLNAFDGDSK